MTDLERDMRLEESFRRVREIIEAYQADEDAACQAAGFCTWGETSELADPPFGRSFEERRDTHPDCPIHGDAR